MDPKQELLKALADALNSYDDAVKALIVDELNSTIRPGLVAVRDQAVARLSDAYAAMELPREQITETDTEIAHAEKELATYREGLESTSIAARASARSVINEGESELSSLRQKRAQQSGALESFTSEHRSAKDALANAELALAGFEMNLESPFVGYGMRTDAHRAFRIGSYPAWLTLLGNNTSHPEFDAFYDSLDTIAAATGYRTDDLSARLLQHAREETQAEFARDPEPVPGGREIIDSELTAIEVGGINRAMDNSPSKIEDHRSPIAAMPRNAVVPGHMQVPGIPAESRRH